MDEVGRTREGAIGKAAKQFQNIWARRFRGVGQLYSQLTSQGNVHNIRYIYIGHQATS